MAADSLKVALSFVEAINSQRIDEMADLMAEDHTFVESDGDEVVGRGEMRESWLAYFALVPDYRIEVEETLVRDNTVVLLGAASGTFIHEGSLAAENHWSVPAALRVVVRDDRVSVWQLYVNTEPMLKIMERLGTA